MLVFMVRGLFSSLKYPYVKFPASSTKGANLFALFRQVVSRLTRLGLHVLATTCDGASDNRKECLLFITVVTKRIWYTEPQMFTGMKRYFSFQILLIYLKL